MAEQKQAVVDVLNTDAWLSGSAVEVLADFGFSRRTLKISLYAFSVAVGSWFPEQRLVIEPTSTSATTGFKLAFKKRASSTEFQIFNAHFAQTLEEYLGLETGSEVSDLQIKVSPMCWILSPFCPLNDHLRSQQQQSQSTTCLWFNYGSKLFSLCLRNSPDRSIWYFVNITQKFWATVHDTPAT